MPIQECTLPGGGKGWRWGETGKCYADRVDAEKQAAAAYANGFTGDAALGLDKASVRTTDADGRMHVSVSNISKANVCPYLGREIPDFEKLGLDPDKIYQLYRHPDELAKAAPTFNNIQLLIKHIPVSADDHQPDKIVGTTGSDAEFVAPYLRNSLAVWAREGIDLIESEKQKELSSAYRYRCDMKPGTTPQGEAYDGVMRDIAGNHVALVEEGRCGPSVMVADGAIDPWALIESAIVTL